MLIETSRRKFLKQSIALSIYGSSVNLFGEEKPKINISNIPITTKTSDSIAKNIPYLCNMCRNKCAGFARIEDGIVTKLNPNPYFPKSRNMLCPKGNSGIQALYDPDRLKYPLIRIGKRGDGKYKRATWDEALEYIKDSLVKILEEEKDNRSTIAYCNGEGFEKEEMIKFFGGKLGSSNFLDEGSICLNTRLGAYLLTIGTVGEPDVAGSDYTIFAGSNRLESLVTPDSIELAKKRDGKIIVIDPRCTVSAIKADIWLPIKPGTDLAFCLAMTYVAFKNELYQKDIVKKHFKDFREYKNLILKSKYTPQWAEQKCGIKASLIEQITREFFGAKRPLFHPGRRSVGSSNDFQFRRAMVLLNALAGNLNKKGGIIYGKPLKLPEIEVNEPLYSNSKDRFDLNGITYGSAKAGSWLNFRDMVLNEKAPYDVRALFVRKHNIMQGIPDINKTKKLLQKLDLIVVIDTMPSDTAVMADIILPECTYLEREDLAVNFNALEPSIALRNQVVEPLYESKPLHTILKRLGRKLNKPLFEISKRFDKALIESIADLGERKAFEEGGYDMTELYKKTVTQRNKEMIVKIYGIEAYKSLKNKGVWYPNMEKYHQKLFNNTYEYYPPNKRFYSIDIDYKVNCKLVKMSRYNLDPFPLWRDEYDYFVPKGKYRLITGRYIYFTQSATSNNEMLRDVMSTNHLWINNKVAKKLNITLGDLVEVKSSISSIHIKAYPTNKIAPDILFFAHGFGESSKELTNAYGNGVSDNEIIEDKMEPVYGDAVMNETNVEIRKI
ncbi:MAG: molybdopterin-dependent oxidoreductase [Sulfurospirillum sp.]